MLRFLKEQSPLLMLMIGWVLAAKLAPVLVMVVVPLTFILLRQREDWAGLLMSMLLVLVLSDARPEYTTMAYFKTVKNICVVLLAGFFFLAQDRFRPTAQVFTIFLPFFIYSVFPLVFSPAISTGVQKTVSFALMYLIVPNYVLFCFRHYGWDFFRNLLFFIVTLMLIGFVLRYAMPEITHIGGRFHGVFGNPNGIAIFCLLAFMLATVVMHVRPQVFSRWDRVLVYGSIVYCLILSGSRSALAAVLIYITIHRFFSYSPALGLVVMLAFMAVLEVVTSNIGAIITFLGLEQYFRLHTLEEGSGRYFAWQFAWEKIQPFFFFGGGFATDETIMRSHYRYLERMGHQGGVHNSYLSMWFNMGIVGLLVYFRSFVLLFIKAAKLSKGAVGVLFATLFSIMYESWLVGSLNPYTIMLLMIMTVISEPEIAQADEPEDEADEEQEEAPGDGALYFASQRTT